MIAAALFIGKQGSDEMRMNGALVAFVAVTFVVASVAPGRAQSPCEVTRVASQVGGAGGSVAGAAIGSAFGPVGTIVGALFGGFWGSGIAGGTTSVISGADSDCIFFNADTGPVPLDGGSASTRWSQMQEYASAAFGNPTSAQLAALDEELAAFAEFQTVFQANQVLSSREPAPVTLLPTVVPVSVNNDGIVRAGSLFWGKHRREQSAELAAAKELIEKAHPRIGAAFGQLARDKRVIDAVIGVNNLGSFFGSITGARGDAVFVPAFLLLNNTAPANRVLRRTLEKAAAQTIQRSMLQILVDEPTLQTPLSESDRKFIKKTISYYHMGRRRGT